MSCATSITIRNAIGFTQREVAAVMLSELTVLTLAAIPAGLWIGTQLAAALSATRGYDHPDGVDLRANAEQTSLDVSLSSFMIWQNYQVIHVSTHGRRLCDDDGECHAMLTAGTYSTTLPAGPESDAEKLKTLMEEGLDTAKGEGSEHGYIALTADFFRAIYGAGVDDAVIFFNACQIAGPTATDLIDYLPFALREREAAL